MTPITNKRSHNTWTPVFEAKVDRMILFGWLIGPIIVMCFAGILMHKAFEDIYPDLAVLILATLVLIGSLLLLRRGLEPGDIIAYNDRIELKSFLPWFHRTIQWDEIESWHEKEHKQKDEVVHSLNVRVKGRRVKFRSGNYRADTYVELVLLFRRLAPEHELNPQRVGEVTYSGLAIAAAVLLLVAILSYFSWEETLTSVQPKDLTHITGIIAHDGKIYKGSKGARSIHIDLANYPKWRFSFDEAAFEATNKTAYVDNVRKGDTLILGISTDQFAKKLTGRQPLGFWDKVWRFREIDVYEFRDKKEPYLTLVEYNNEDDISGPGWVLYFSILALVSLLGALAYKLGNR